MEHNVCVDVTRGAGSTSADDGVNGFLVSSVEEAADRIARLLKDEKLCEEIGCRARETVREKFLLTRYVEQYLDLFGAFDKFGSVKQK